MNQFFNGLGGPVVQMIGALLVVVALIVLIAWVARRFRGPGSKQPARRGDRPTQRLAVVDAAHVDGQRRLVLVRRDDVEHLVMIGGPNDVLIEPRIVRGQPLGGQRTTPQAAPYPTAAPMAPPVAAQQPPQAQPQPRPVRATAEQPQPLQQPITAGQPGAVPMPPPFVEPVTSPAAPNRANPVAADLRAAMGDGRDGRRPDDYVDTQRDPYAGRQPTAPQPQMTAPPPIAPPMAPSRPQQPVYDEPTVAARPAYAEPTAYAPPQRQAPSRPAPEPTPALSLEDMVAAGLEQAISRPDPVPARPTSRTAGPAFGQRVEPSAYDTRTPAKDAVAAEIEKAIYGLTTPGAGMRPQPGRAAPPPTRERPVLERPMERPMERPTGRLDRADPGHSEPTVPVSRMPAATPPVFPRPQPAPARPTLVAQQEPEPVVAVLPQPDTVRGDARADASRRTSSDIEDEMARLLSELTGTAGR